LTAVPDHAVERRRDVAGTAKKLPVAMMSRARGGVIAAAESARRSASRT
jgi:hypothetical protein